MVSYFCKVKDNVRIDVQVCGYAAMQNDVLMTGGRCADMQMCGWQMIF
jgi:hypothetical protein